jgi:hypothetical protein
MKCTQRATSILIVKSKEWAVSVELTYSLFSFGIVERILHNIYPNSKIRTEKFQKFCQNYLQTFHGTVQNFCDKKVLLDIENLPIIRILSCFKKRKKTFKKCSSIWFFKQKYQWVFSSYFLYDPKWICPGSTGNFFTLKKHTLNWWWIV